MVRYITIIFACLLLSACETTEKYEPQTSSQLRTTKENAQKDEKKATSEKYKAVLDTWLGASEEELLQSWGPPDNVYNISKSKKLLTFNRTRDFILSGSSFHFYCKTTITIEDGKIIFWRFEGNECVST